MRKPKQSKTIAAVVDDRMQHVRVELKGRFHHVTFPCGESIRVGIDYKHAGRIVDTVPEHALYAAIDWLNTWKPSNRHLKSFLVYALAPATSCGESIAWACEKMGLGISAARAELGISQ